MKTEVAVKTRSQFVNESIRRRRWANVGAVYLFLLVLSILFIGPFFFAFLSSIKDDPLEWPPKLSVNQFKFKNLAAAYQLGRAGGGGGFFGEFTPGARIPFEITYKVEPGQEPSVPEVAIPRRVSGYAAAALQVKHWAADNTTVSKVREAGRKVLEDGSTLVTYRFEIAHTGKAPVDRLPLDITVPHGQLFVSATLEPNRIERLGRVQSWNNLTSGVVPYVFYSYHRAFRENYSRSTGKSLFLSWIGNSFYFATVRVVTTLLLASMAGYALARLRFRGRRSIFLFMLFSMMIPAQVTFISNYLVLRDGLFGFTRLFGVPTLLNTYTGLILTDLVAAGKVFIMKQFFEGLPASLDEAARIDGASAYQIFFRVMLPQIQPALAAVAILTFQGAWNEFFWPLVVLTSPMDKFPLTVGLLSFRHTYGVAFDWGPMLAGAFVSAAPIIILFIVFQKYFVEGISTTGIKG